MSANTSSCARMSPCTKCTPARANRARFSSEPRRCRLSSTMMRVSGKHGLRAIARVDPTKPAPPVISMQSYMVNVESRLVLLSAVLPVIITTSEMFLQPHVQDNKQIPTPHLLDFQLGDAGLSVRPADRPYREGIAADNGLQRHLHGEIKMGGNERLYPLDHFSTIQFEGIGEVVEGDAEERLDEPVRQAVQDQFVDGIVTHLTAADESGAKDTIRPFQ